MLKKFAGVYVEHDVRACVRVRVYVCIHIIHTGNVVKSSSGCM